MANPKTNTVVQKLVTLDTSASSLVVGGASETATTGTGGVNAGTVLGNTSVSDSVGTMATIRAGGLALTSQAAGDVIYATSASQYARLNGSGLLQLNGAGAPTVIAPSSTGAVTLIGEVEGTNTAAAATNVATFAISGLTVKDHLHIVLRHSAASQIVAAPVLYNSTDSVTVMSFLGGALGADTTSTATVDIMADQSAATEIIAQGMFSSGMAAAGGDNTGSTRATTSVFTTAWTGSWTLALRTGAGGVTAGGTYRYRMSVYKVAGQ